MNSKRRAQRPPEPTFDQYVVSFPSQQNAVDLVPGWNTSFPPEFNIVAGHLATYSDARIVWALQQYGDVSGKSILELGPLEAGHTFQIERAGGRVDAIEANKLAFMRCLIAKEIYRLNNARFHLGDFTQWLERSQDKYDLVVASGVLYHMRDPLRLIELVAAAAPAAYYWTHVIDETGMPKGDPRRSVFSDEVEETSFHGVRVRLYRRTYLDSAQNSAFCGGVQDDHRWIVREDFLAALAAAGYRQIEIAHDAPDHPNGSALSVFARK